jgi:hypothetical protein
MVNFYKQLQLNKMHLLKHSSPVLNSFYAVTLAHHWDFKRNWSPAIELENLESKLDFKLKFGLGQTDRKGLGSVPERYNRNPNLWKRKA